MPVSLVRKGLVAIALFSATALYPAVGTAETILGALARAYQNNSALNSARAGVRVTDENVPIAKSGYRPTVNGFADIDYTSRTSNNGTRLATGGFGVQINQLLFDGFRTKNSVASAEAEVHASNESLRNTELNTLFNAASAYMDVILFRRIVSLREQNLEFLSEQVRAAQSRFEVGEGTRTDVAQANAARATAVAQVADARAQLRSAEGTYRQVVGQDPGRLGPASPLARLLPKSFDQAVAIAAEGHPAILATEHLVDSAVYSVKVAEGALLPQLSAQATLSRDYSNISGGIDGGGGSSGNGWSSSASIGANLTVPIYQGGRTSAQVRQSKESLGQARIEVDVQRDQVQNAVTSAWAQYNAALQGVSAARESVSAAQLALSGVIEERNVGQRTTLDVLNSQADVINAQINLANFEREVVVGSYAILSAIGWLTVDRLNLQVARYNPKEHYRAVKDKWYGLRTPDGR